jgi:hypothetical protein
MVLLFVTKPFFINVIKQINSIDIGKENEIIVIRVLNSVHGAIKIVINLLCGEAI